MRGNIVNVNSIEGTLRAAETLTQYDFGQVIKFNVSSMPEDYEVHFAHSEIGISITVQGSGGSVPIPDELLETGQDIHVWVYGHAGEGDGETEYHFMIKVQKRAKITDIEPVIPAEGVEF